jgi:transcriptional regulator with XRE-family HTH domain
MSKLSKQEEVFLKELGKRIAQIRKQKELTQAALGDLLDIEKPSMSRLENGNTNPTIITLKRICKELNIELKDLFS